MSASASSSQLPPSPSPTVLLFARGLIAILDLWPALTIAVAEQWGGPESADKKIWMASTILDEWEQRTNYLPSPISSTSTSVPPQIDPKDASDPPLDLDDLGDLINQMMTDEFESKIEDGSIDAVASDIIRLWRDLLVPQPNIAPEALVAALELKAASTRKTGIQASRGADPVEGEDLDSGESDSEDDDEGMDVDETPQLVPREKERVEPVVDDDGFTLVQTKGRKGR